MSVESVRTNHLFKLEKFHQVQNWFAAYRKQMKWYQKFLKLEVIEFTFNNDSNDFTYAK